MMLHADMSEDFKNLRLGLAFQRLEIGKLKVL